MPEKLTGQSPENIAQLTEKLTQTLASIPDGANFRTDEMIEQDGIFLMERLAQQKKGFLGLGRKRVDEGNPDHLWVAAQILYSGKEALEKYFITASALIRALGENVEGKTAEDIHNQLTRNKELLYELNSRQILHGDYAVLTLLDDLIKKDQAKEEVKESSLETGDYAALDLFAGINIGRRGENQDFVAHWHPYTPEGVKKYGLEFTEHEAKILRKGNIVVVADGISLSADGKRASNEAGTGIIGRFIATDESEDPWDFLRRAMTETNQDIYNLDPDNLGSMQTTAVTALIRGHNLYLAHIGDSRAYILRGGMLHRLTRDHSWVEEIEDGIRTLQEFRERFPGKNPTRNIITRSMGSRIPLEVDDTLRGPIPLAKGDKILLCTDGLWGPVDDQTIGAIVMRSKNSEEAVRQLITAAVDRGGEDADNIGVAVINVDAII